MKTLFLKFANLHLNTPSKLFYLDSTAGSNSASGQVGVCFRSVTNKDTLIISADQNLQAEPDRQMFTPLSFARVFEVSPRTTGNLLCEGVQRVDDEHHREEK